MKKLRPFLALGLAMLYYALLPAQTSTHRSCVLPIGPPSEIPISKPFKGLIPEEKMATITVDFLSSGSVFGNTCITWDVDAQAAFNFAVSIYEPLFTSTQTIQIQACWSNDLPAGTLGSAGAFSFSQLFQSGNSLGFFPRPLVEKLTNSNNGPVDIIAVFNAGRSDWYFGTDAVPQPTMLDFVTVVLHEITHGMGFTGNASVDDGTGDAECNGVANTSRRYMQLQNSILHCA